MRGIVLWLTWLALAATSFEGPQGAVQPREALPPALLPMRVGGSGALLREGRPGLSEAVSPRGLGLRRASAMAAGQALQALNRIRGGQAEDEEHGAEMEVEDDEEEGEDEDKGADAGAKFKGVEEQLKELKECLDDGLISNLEFERERERVLMACAKVGTDLDELYVNDPEGVETDADNHTVERQANNEIAKSMAYGQRKSTTQGALGSRIHGSVAFSDSEFGVMRRGTRRQELEQEAGLQRGDLRDMRPAWREAAQRLCKELMNMTAPPPGEPLREVCFKARRDLGVGEVVAIVLRNYTRADAAELAEECDHTMEVACSPFGKITLARWGQLQRVLNLTIAQPVFQDEPIRVILPEDCGIRVDTSSLKVSSEEFMDMLFDGDKNYLSRIEAADDNATHADWRPGQSVVIVGLRSASELNGALASVIGRNGTRYQVRVKGTGRKIQVLPENLQDSAGEKVARETKDLMSRLYSNKTTGKGSIFQGQEVLLSDQDVEDLLKVNITVDDKRHSLTTTHYDGGMGRFIVTPFGDMDGDEEALGLRSDEHVRREIARDRARGAKQLILDQHLQVAAKDGDADRIEALLAAGANISTTRFSGTQHGSYQRTPLHVAAWETKVKAAQALIFHNASVNARDSNLATPLHHAAIKGEPALIRVLLDAGADPRLLNVWNRSCIHRAMFYGRQEAQDMMVQHVGDDYDDREIADVARFSPVEISRAEELRQFD